LAKRVAGAASPNSAALQKIVELDQRCQWPPDVHRNAAGRVEHLRRATVTTNA
jgi:hypothetical protein